MESEFAEDLANVARIDAVQTILEVVCRTTGMGFAAVARVTDTRWVACAVRDEIAFGMKPGGELQLNTTLCDEVRASGEPIVIDHVAADGEFCGHHTPQMYGFQSYISMPIHRKSGQFFGTLCAIDPQPARLKTPQVIGMFKLFAELIGLQLEAQERVSVSERALVDERKTAELREEFIAVLGHDLRTPLAAIEAAATVLQKSNLEKRGSDMAALIRRSTARMADMVGNVLDLARGRLGGGLALARTSDARLGDVLEQVVNEQRTTSPNRTIESDIKLTRVIACDSGRIAQLLANLLANAIAYGNSSGVVRVDAHNDDETFELSVANRGDPIPAQLLDKVFEPFNRGARVPGQQGLGLGLYIASQIARGHDGTLSVVSTQEETRFTLRMPIANSA